MTGKFCKAFLDRKMNKLFEYINSYYQPSQYPALSAQLSRWREQRPLAGMKILDGTPVFRNTVVKYAVLLAAGADLTVSAGEGIPFDPEVIRKVPEFGIRVADPGILQEKFDVVADCAGRHRQVRSRCGYVELTRSGLQYYSSWKQPVFSADSGVLKKLETVLGTGEGFLRAMQQLGYNDFAGKNILIFGGGKVGYGVAFYAQRAGASVTVADLNQVELPENVSFINVNDLERIRQAIAEAWCIVSVTGIAGALSFWADDLNRSSALIANMGVEDEFGPAVPDSRVLNNKLPLNFILDEPTHLKYIDATMALNNCGIEKLIAGKVSGGINFPERELEKLILRDIKNGGMIAAEMEFITAELE